MIGATLLEFFSSTVLSCLFPGKNGIFGKIGINGTLVWKRGCAGGNLGNMQMSRYADVQMSGLKNASIRALAN